MWGRTTKVLLAAALLVAPGALFSAEERPPTEGHREDPVPPPKHPVSRADQARSPRAVITRGLVQSVQVNVDAMQNNIVGDAANEPSMAIDPTNPDNIIIGWRQFGSISSDFRQAGMAYSHDGGLTWTFPGPLDPIQFRSDPVLAADNHGDFFYYSLSSVTTAEYFVTFDKGITWTPPIPAPGGDKNWHTIDNSGGVGDGHIYALWNSQFTCCAVGTDFTRSTDSAVSFGGPYVLPSKPKWGTDAVGPDGELYVVGTNLNGVGHLILRSADALDDTLTPSFPVVTSMGLGGNTGANGPPNPGGLLGQVWVAVDHSMGSTRGNVYVLGSVDPTGADPLDVNLIRSVDGGLTWSLPTRVNSDPQDNGAYQWFGTMAVAPDGRIDVAWNDTRAGPATISELYYAYSLDAGVTFSAGLAVTPPFDSTVGHPVQNKIGDYYHMVSEAETAALAYSATFNGEQDVYFVRLGDCNANGTHDSADIESQSSPDLNSNGIPDECEPDCNGNGIPDETDLAMGASDCNDNSIPDTCDIDSGVSADCNSNGILDECDVTFDFETNPGFTVGAAGDSATSGIWVRLDPIGTAAQPEDDHTPSPGTACFVTGQGTVGGALGENDVDGGVTTLLSQSLDLTGFADPWIGYWRWYSNNSGSAPASDRLTIEISNDGGMNWSIVEVVGPSGVDAVGGWRHHGFRVNEIVTPTADVQLRFVASDKDLGSIVEAALDDLIVIDCGACPLAIPGEVTGLTLVVSGNSVDLSWGAVQDAANYAVYRGTSRDASDLACLESGLTMTMTTDEGLLPAEGQLLFYVVSAANCAGESVLGSSRQAIQSCP